MTQTAASIEIKNPIKSLAYTYVISLSIIALLSIIVHFMLDKVIAEQSATGKVVNISGQQRMLSQRSSLFAMEYLMLGTEQAKTYALNALDKMQQNHTWLLEPHYQALNNGEKSPLSPTLLKMYFEEPLNVNAKIKLFSRQINDALQNPSETDLISQIKSGFLVLAEEPLLYALNEVVGLYERESVEKVNKLRFAQNVVLGIIILTIIFEALLVFRPMVDKISQFAYKLQYDANVDHLTGLLNRRALNLQAEKVVAASLRYKRTLGVVIFDIDLFKTINDTYGHAAGDLAIKHVSALLRENSRTSDFVARFGGEEFVMLLPETDSEGCFHVAENIRKQIKNTPFKFEDKSIDLAISAGVAMFKPQHSDIEEPLRLADEALYQSKQNGRNLVTIYQENS